MPSLLFTKAPLPLAIARLLTLKVLLSVSAALPSNCAVVITRAPLSSAIATRVTGLVVGASLTGETVMSRVESAPVLSAYPIAGTTPFQLGSGVKRYAPSAAIVIEPIPVNVAVWPETYVTPFTLNEVTVSALSISTSLLKTLPTAVESSPIILISAVKTLGLSIGVSAGTNCACGVTKVGFGLDAGGATSDS